MNAPSRATTTHVNAPSWFQTAAVCVCRGCPRAACLLSNTHSFISSSHLFEFELVNNQQHLTPPTCSPCPGGLDFIIIIFSVFFFSSNVRRGWDQVRRKWRQQWRQPRAAHLSAGKHPEQRRKRRKREKSKFIRSEDISCIHVGYCSVVLLCLGSGSTGSNRTWFTGSETVEICLFKKLLYVSVS